jgi:hypothetical protein
MRKFWLSPNTVGNGILWLVGAALQIGDWTSPTVAYVLFGIAFVWLIITVIYWLRNKDRYEAMQLQDIIASIPTILDELHNKRGLLIKIYVRRGSKENDFKALNNMSIELDQFLGGSKKLHDKLTSTLANVEGGEEILSLFEEIIPQSDKQPEVQLTDYEVARLLASSAKTHLPIEDMLNRCKKLKFQRLTKSLDSARNKLPSIMVVKATEAIDYYLTYSEAYWAVNAILLSVTYSIRGMPVSKETIAQMETAYNLYEDRFRKLMNISKAKVCEVINDYTLLTWDKVRKK